MTLIGPLPFIAHCTIFAQYAQYLFHNIPQGAQQQYSILVMYV